jgi:4-aminobutyrate aminotransferase/(S)-3-amino-2-methylpropionate transaminase
VACAAALAVFDIVEEEGLCARAEAIGRKVRECFTGLQARYPVVGDVRGQGAMMAMELVEDPESKQPAAALTKELRMAVFERGVLCLAAGAGDNVLRVLLPLTIEDATLDTALARLSEAMHSVMGKRTK